MVSPSARASNFISAVNFLNIINIFSLRTRLCQKYCLRRKTWILATFIHNTRPIFQCVKLLIYLFKDILLYFGWWCAKGFFETRLNMAAPLTCARVRISPNHVFLVDQEALHASAGCRTCVAPPLKSKVNECGKFRDKRYFGTFEGFMSGVLCQKCFTVTCDCTGRQGWVSGEVSYPTDCC